MSDRVFLDTNVIVYQFDTAPASAAKRRRAREILANPDLVVCLSAQVLGEFYVTVTRKLPEPLDTETAGEAIASLSLLGVVPTDAQLVRSAVETSATAQLSYWDALIIEAARLSGCSQLLTEDLSDGALIRDVRIENPFRGL